MEKDYLSPREVVFDWDTSRWVIKNLGLLKLGHWPPDASSYTDAPITNRAVNSNASFVMPIECHAEMMTRLERCGQDGLILLAMLCWDESPEAMKLYLGFPEWSLSKRYNQALRYVASGHARRWLDTKKRQGISYRDFKAMYYKW